MFKIILASLFLLVIGLFLIILGYTALSSPQKIVNFNLYVFNKVGYSGKIKKWYMNKLEKGDFERAWRKAGWVLIFMGFIYIYALVSYLIMVIK